MIFPRPNPMHILRVGLAITFLWIGVIILDDPVAWAGFVPQWVRELLFLPVGQAMIGNAIFDIVIGLLLLLSTNKWMTWVGSLLASFHMITVLAVAGIDPVTVRDIAILAGALSLLSWSWPETVWPRQTR